MSREDFSDAALVLVGHGSTFSGGAGAPVFQHASELRRRGGFAEVREGFWKQEPRIMQVLSDIRAQRVFVVPLFISEGYFSDRIIPKALGFTLEGPGDAGRVQCRAGQTLVYCRPVGTHESLAKILLARARQVIEQFPFPRAPKPQESTLFIAGHGTQKEENSRKAIERQAELVRGQNLYADVQAVFLEEEPRISSCFQMAKTKNIIVVPFFLGEGPHVQEDIPILLGEPEKIVKDRLQRGKPSWRNPTEKHGKLVWYGASVGTEPSLAEVILERVREGVAWAGEIKSPQ